MPDLGTIKSNVSKMLSQGAPESDIDSYIQAEGSTVDAVKNFQIKPESIMNNGLSYVQQHPFKSLLQDPLHTITGEGISPRIDRTIGGVSPFQKAQQMYPGNKLAQANAFGESFMTGLGGDIAGMATAPISAIGGAIGAVAPKIPMITNAGKAITESGIGKTIGGVLNHPVGGFSKVKDLDNHIISTYSQAVNPSIGKINNSVKYNEFQNKTVNAMKTIADNVDNIKFENPSTGAVETRLPKNRVETFEALNQTKQHIYEQYNSLQKSATEAGATVDVPEIAKTSFGDITKSRQYKLYEPDLISDAQMTMNRLSKSGHATPQEVQEDIAFLNNKMKSYYNKGDYNGANIYASYAANLRAGLDSSIEKALEKAGYQDLKNKYASLKYVEGDLSKAAARQLKNINRGLGESFSNPIALAEMARGILTGNPAEFGTGLAIKTFSTLQKAVNHPDWRIESMFKNISKFKKPLAAGAIGIVANAGNASADQIKDEDAIKAIIGEAENQGVDGMRGVASAIRNRENLKGVFGLKAPRVLQKKYSPKIYEQAKQAWLDSKKKDFVDGATHWEGTSFKTPYWAKDMNITKTIRQQRFYKRK